MVRFLTYFIFIFYINSTFGQSGYKFELKYNSGFVIPHYYYMPYLINSHINGLQLQAGKKTESNQPGKNVSTLGIGLHFSSLGNSLVYGNLASIYLFTQSYFYSGNFFNIGNQVGLGIGYVSKPFRLYSNPLNMSVSTHLNAYINYCLFGSFKLGNAIQLNTGLGVTHISNGNLRKPNVGLNFLNIQAGLEFEIPGSSHSDNSAFTLTDEKKFYSHIGFTWGIKQISRFFNTMYPIYALSYDWHYSITYTQLLGAAISGYYDTSLKKEINLEDSTKFPTHSSNYRLALFASYQIKNKYFAYLFQPGIYLINPYKKIGVITNRVGIRYYFSKNVTASILIKAHWKAIADYIEWGLGYTF